MASASPAKGIAIVTCMDCRLDVLGALGLKRGDAHVLRNAGGVITDDVIRSLAISQRRLDTREVILVHHTDCGMEKLSDDGFREDCERRAVRILPSRSSPSPTSTPMSRSRSSASAALPSLPAASPCAASSTTSTPTACAR